ncbi:hypothetical protein AC1031_001664 [Aphanomyces cochlioides]|nr:hypothetical protein AC1031_001664 [Aphanomyces cochlioides]
MLVFATFSMGTVLGDLVAFAPLEQGYLVSIYYVYLGLFGAGSLTHAWNPIATWKINPVFVFWYTSAMTRPLGATKTSQRRVWNTIWIGLELFEWTVRMGDKFGSRTLPASASRRRKCLSFPRWLSMVVQLYKRDIQTIKDVDYFPAFGSWDCFGRALFTASTTRMWCDPGYGMNPNQGRDAPEIDILEGSGAAISTSIQVTPGMPDEYRRMPTQRPDNSYCVYGKGCVTPGANIPDAPTSAFASRGHKNWYQGLRYAANDHCPPVSTDAQTYEQVAAVRANPALLTSNVYDKTQMSASRDVNGDLGLIDGKGTKHWGINYNGMCFPIANGYIGAYLCDPDSKNPRCAAPRREGVTPTKQMDSFEYQMDAVSVNWDISHDAYTTFYIYHDGHIKWYTDAKNPMIRVDGGATCNSDNDVPEKLLRPKQLGRRIALD